MNKILYNIFLIIIVGTQGPRKTKTSMTIIRSLGGSILNPRSVFAPEKEGRDKIPPGNPSGENGVQGESQGT